MLVHGAGPLLTPVSACNTCCIRCMEILTPHSCEGMIAQLGQNNVFGRPSNAQRTCNPKQNEFAHPAIAFMCGNRTQHPTLRAHVPSTSPTGPTGTGSTNAKCQAKHVHPLWPRHHHRSSLLHFDNLVSTTKRMGRQL